MTRLLSFTLTVLLLAYPVGVYFGLQHLQPRYLGLALLVLLLGRLLVTGRMLDWNRLKPLLPVTVAGAALCLLVLLFNQVSLIRLMPVLINAVLLAVFAYTLFHPPSLIERIARLTEPNLSGKGVRYTRNVTVVWCIFFILNGLAALYTAVYSSLAAWTLYNGLIAYLLIGSLFLAEYGVRHYIHKH